MQALEPALEQLIDRAVLAGWPREMVARAILGLARYEADKAVASTLDGSA